MTDFVRPYLYPKQAEAMFCVERYGFIEASTKSGKTVSAIAWIIEKALKGVAGQNFWWVAPGYNQSEIAYRRIKTSLTRGAFVPFDTPTPRVQLMNGTVIWFKSADNPDALYGEDVYACVIDEASRIAETAWHAVRSTLTATRGPVRAIGNVKGRKNWFFNLARRAEAMMLSEPDPAKRNMHYAKITADDAVAGGVLDAEEIEDARATLPEWIFRELYYAEPGDDLGNPFGIEHIRACTTAELAPGPVVAWGIDLAKAQDYLVCIGLNKTGGVAAFHRWRGLPWRKSIRAIWELVGEDTPALVDSTGVGDPVLEELQVEHGNFLGYHFSATSKQKLMEGLAVSIQGHEVSFPRGYITQELESFEYAEVRTGTRYSAPEGQNDDCVCALALARQMWTEVQPGTNLIEYYAQLSERMKSRASTLPTEPKRPWEDAGGTTGNEVTVGSIFENELDAVYETAVATALGGSSRMCCACGLDVPRGAQISDGELIWHPACAGAAPKFFRRAELVSA